MDSVLLKSLLAIMKYYIARSNRDREPLVGGFRMDNFAIMKNLS